MHRDAPLAVLRDLDARPPRTALERDHGGVLHLDPARVAVNFVSTLDGIVSFGRTADDSRAVGGGLPADRMLMAMLRALAGTIVIGAGTLRATLHHQWTPGALLPERDAELRELRALAGRPAELAPLLVVSANGEIPADADAIARPAVPVAILTAAGVLPPAGAPATSTTATTSAAPVSGAAIVAAARERAAGGPVLCEGGPRLFGALLEAGLPLDLFLTVAPQLAGRSSATPERRSLVEGVAFAPFSRPAELRAVRAAGDHLLLRYRVDPA